MTPAIEQFSQAIRAAGIEPPDAIESDGKLHRFASKGKRSDDSGWYILHGDGLPAGAFGDWRTGLSETWCGKADRTLTDAEKRAQRERIEQAKREAEAKRQQTHAEARDRAARYWRDSKPCDSHPYLQRKGVKSHGVRVYHGPQAINGMPLHGCIVVPARDADGMLHTLEFIHPEPRDGDNKRFLPGGEKSGHYFAIGKPNGVLCIAEGYATGASIHEATGHAVAVAFDAGNLEPVARALRAKFPDLALILCADDDAATEGNPGLTKATAAARTVGGRLAVPDFGENRPNDATDFNDLGRHAGADAIRRCFEAAAKSVDAPQRDGEGASEGKHQGVKKRAAAGTDSFVVRCIADIEAQPIRWLWPGRIACGKITDISGDPGLGKSQATISLAAILSTGGRFPVDRTQCERGSVVFLSAEDDAADTIRPRLEAAGADLTRCHILEAIRVESTIGEVRDLPFSLERDTARLAELFILLDDVRLLVIDPISAYTGRTDSYKNAEVRGLLAPLAKLAAQFGVAVVTVSHLTKGAGNKALMRVSGSVAFVAAARAAYVVARDDETPTRRLFLPTKNNLGSDQGGLAFSIECVTLPSGIETTRVMWEANPVTVTADEVLAQKPDGEEQTERAEAVIWLRELFESGQSFTAKQVRAEADKAGLAWRTVQRAKTAADVVSIREGFGKDSAYVWRLNNTMRANNAHACHLSDSGAHGIHGTHEGVDGPPDDAVVI